MQEYFFIAVSTKENLEICKKYAYAGFPGTINGVWAYSDIKVGDFVTFLYGARAHNLYRVIKKEAIADAEKVPPWKPIYFILKSLAGHAVFLFDCILNQVANL